MNALRKKNGLELLDEAKRSSIDKFIEHEKKQQEMNPDTHSDFVYTDEDKERHNPRTRFQGCRNG